MKCRSERKRSVRAFRHTAGAAPEPLWETEAFSRVKGNEKSTVLRRSFEFGWYHESLRPIMAAGFFLLYFTLNFY